jgi:tRNA threonylcarbamoyladenosine biosynthesis protein TsaE
MPILDAHTVEVFSRSPEQTRRVGMRLGALLQPGDLVCLEGELGAGKTTLVQGVAQGWGSLDPVSSPTFVLVNLYRRPEGSELFHLDAYRLDSAPEAEELDIDGMLARGALVVEWPERVRAALPREGLWANFDIADDDQRDMRFVARGPRYEGLLNTLRRGVYGGD